MFCFMLTLSDLVILQNVIYKILSQWAIKQNAFYHLLSEQQKFKNSTSQQYLPNTDRQTQQNRLSSCMSYCLPNMYRCSDRVQDTSHLYTLPGEQETNWTRLVRKLTIGSKLSPNSFSYRCPWRCQTFITPNTYKTKLVADCFQVCIT